jgi:hypothetical protein
LLMMMTNEAHKSIAYKTISSEFLHSATLT